MESLESELERARALDVDEIAASIREIGFECTRCGACCKAEADDPHTATVFPDEVREIQAAAAGGDEASAGGDSATTEQDGTTPGAETAESYDWRDVARPMPYGISEGPEGPTGETFEWALATDDCGDCTFYEEADDGTGACTVHSDRPLVCQTYPFSIRDVDERQHDEGGGLGTTEPMGGVVEQEGMVQAHECEGLGRDISREDAEDMAVALKERVIRELEEAIGVRDNYQPTDVDSVVVHDSEGQKRPDGTPIKDME